VSNLSEKDFIALKAASKAILEGRRKEHEQKAGNCKVHAIYIDLTPSDEYAPSPEVIVEKALGDSNYAEALFHDAQAKRYAKAIEELAATTYEESN